MLSSCAGSKCGCSPDACPSPSGDIVDADVDWWWWWWSFPRADEEEEEDEPLPVRPPAAQLICMQVLILHNHVRPYIGVQIITFKTGKRSGYLAGGGMIHSRMWRDIAAM
jgi:hypothetical protein